MPDEVKPIVLNQSIGSLEQFDVEKGELWTSYEERFALYCNCNGIDENRKAAMLISMAGSGVYEILKASASPTKVIDLTYKEVIEYLNKYFIPKPSSITSFYLFVQRNQLPEENVLKYFTELQKIAVNCKFGELLDTLLVKRVICGLRDASLQKSFLQDNEDKLTKTYLLEKASIAESAKKNQEQISSDFVNKEDKEVNKISGFRNKQNKAFGKCHRCGISHQGDCIHKESICFKCQSKGHIASVCKSKAANKTPKQSYYKANNRSVNQVASSESAMKANIEINGKIRKFEVDNGSGYSIISMEEMKKIWKKDECPQLNKCLVKLQDFQRRRIPVIGQCQIRIKYNQKTVDNLPLIIVKGNVTNILGRNWFGRLGISISGVHEVRECHINKVINRFESIFSEELGCYQGPPVRLEIDHKIKPKSFPPRPVPIPLKSAVEEEINKLVNQGVLVPVEYSDWATPIVPVKKSDNTVRLCGDYRATINTAIKSHQFKVPSIQSLLCQIQRGSVFAKIDLAQAYQQLRVDEETAKLQTIVTEIGAFKVTRLQFGVSSAPGVFMNFMQKHVNKIKGVYAFLDDVIVTAAHEDQLANRLEQLFSIFETLGLRLKRSKCVFNKKSVEFLGFRVSGDGISPLESKVDAIKKAPLPKNKKELQAFLGLINFYNMFLKDKAAIAEPLHRLLDKNVQFNWTNEHTVVVEELKNLISSDQCLTHYDLNLPLFLSSDCSSYGLGSVLSHQMKDGTERPIAYFSRTLSKAERNYSQIDREATALIAGVRKFHTYLYGRKCTLITDHKPLLAILGENKQCPSSISPQMLRRRNFLSAYDYKLEYKPGKTIVDADYLSRFPLGCQPNHTEEPEGRVNLIDVDEDQLLNHKVIFRESKKSKDLVKISEWIKNGWPNKMESSDSHLKAYFDRRDQLSLLEGCVIFGQRVVIPEKLTKSMLQVLHSGHQGMNKMKALARTSVYWSGMDAQIEELVRKCRNCQENRPEKRRMEVHQWDPAPHAFSRIHIDFMGPIRGKLFLVIVDAFSRWIDVQEVPSTSAAAVIPRLRRLFAYFGVVDTICSDNGSPFSSKEFAKFCRDNLIHHIRIAPYKPSSNGMAERTVFSAKAFLKKLPIKADIQKELAEFLLAQRVTPIVSLGGKSPSELMNGRRLTTCLTKMNPAQSSTYKMNFKNNELFFSRHQRVFIRNYSSGPRWIEARVLYKHGYRNYMVEVADGRKMKRHVDQIRPKSYEDEGSSAEIEIEPDKTTLNSELDEENDEDEFQDASDIMLEEDDPIEVRRSERIREIPMKNYKV